MDAVELGLRAMGAFYVFAGYVATRAALTSHLIDRALAAISAAKPAPVETAQSLWVLGAANLILIGGAALVLLLDAAAWVFVASALGQAAYLFIVAPVYFDASDPPDPNAAANRRTPSSSTPRRRLSSSGPPRWAAWRAGRRCRGRSSP
jgi:hypothetical protein